LHQLVGHQKIQQIVIILVKLVKPEQEIFVLLVLKTELESQLVNVLQDIMNHKDQKIVNHVQFNVLNVSMKPTIVMYVPEIESINQLATAQNILMTLVKKYAHHAQMNVKLVNLMEHV